MVAVSTSSRSLTLTWPDGLTGAYAAVWLRDLCSCSECRHPGSGQRLMETAAIPPDIAIVEAEPNGSDVLIVRFSGEPHSASFSLGSLRAVAEGGPIGMPARPQRILWGSELTGDLPAASFADVTTDELALRDWLGGAARYGVALLHGVPQEPGAVAEVASLFAHVRETNYGRVFDVRAVVDPTNLADTALPLGVHTDNPYRDPTPTLQLLHCLVSNVEGGDTILVDGFKAVERLRAEAPSRLERLATEPVAFAFRDSDNDLAAEFPIVTLGQHGEPVAVRFNNRSKTAPAGTPRQVEAWYEAYRAFARLLASPDAEVRLRLEPGDLVLLENTRVLHGRTGFSAGGKRLLQGCYAERDGLLSRLAVLERRFESGRW